MNTDSKAENAPLAKKEGKSLPRVRNSRFQAVLRAFLYCLNHSGGFSERAQKPLAPCPPPRYIARREWQSEPAAIERAAAVPRGSRVVAFHQSLLNPTAATGGGVFYLPDRPAVLTRKRNDHAQRIRLPNTVRSRRSTCPTASGRTAPSRARPIWCSVDLRDGNQALAIPMNVGQKLELFQTLVKCGFKEIEVGFPSASNTEFTFNRRLIEEHRAPDDVWLQVLVQAREDLIERTFESLVGAKKAIIHLYNSTSPAQRRVVFGMSKEEILRVAVRGAKWIQERLPRLKGTEVRLQYSPESFSATEVEFAKEVSEAVMEVWKPTPQRKMILNLPDTVEVATPNVYADQIEWICRNIKNRDSLIISLHTHNDRCTGVAATELGLLAGADRVEGTLFGNGERTGNLDIVTVALNLYMHGIDPKLDFTDLNAICEVYERCTGMTVPPRHPYAGELVFTAFSGSHQDAIKKGLAEWGNRPPATLGRAVSDD